MNDCDAERPLEALSFEEALDELEQVVQQLEEGELPLDQAIALYERGMGLARRCSQALDAAELQIEQLAVIDGQQQLGFFVDEDGPAS